MNRPTTHVSEKVGLVSSSDVAGIPGVASRAGTRISARQPNRRAEIERQREWKAQSSTLVSGSRRAGQGIDGTKMRCRLYRDETSGAETKMHHRLYTTHSQMIDGSRPDSLIRSIIHHIGVKYEISAPPSLLPTPEVSRPHTRP